MEQKTFKVLRDFVQHPSGKLYRKGAIYESTSYVGSPYIKAMQKFGFLTKASSKDIEQAKRQARRYKIARKRVEEWKHSI